MSANLVSLIFLATSVVFYLKFDGKLDYVINFFSSDRRGAFAVHPREEDSLHLRGRVSPRRGHPHLGRRTYKVQTRKHTTCNGNNFLGI